MHWHVSDDRAPGSPRLSVAKRAVLWWGANDCSVHADVYFRQPYSHGFGGYLRFDGPDAETPVDAAIFLGPGSAFAGTNIGRRLCRWLRVKNGSSRQISVEIRIPENGWRNLAEWVFCWLLWTDPDHQVRPSKWVIAEEKLSRWYMVRRGYITPMGAVLDMALGKSVCTTTKSDPINSTAHFEDGPVPVRITLETRRWHRPRSPRTVTRIAPWVDVLPLSEGGPGHVPTGRYSYGVDRGPSGASVRELTPREADDPSLWVPIAVASFTGTVLRDRARVGWKPPRTEENR